MLRPLNITCLQTRSMPDFSSALNAALQARAGIILVPSAFTQKTGEAHWHVLNQARARISSLSHDRSCFLTAEQGWRAA